MIEINGKQYEDNPHKKPMISSCVAIMYNNNHPWKEQLYNIYVPTIDEAIEHLKRIAKLDDRVTSVCFRGPVNSRKEREFICVKHLDQINKHK